MCFDYIWREAAIHQPPPSPPLPGHLGGRILPPGSTASSHLGEHWKQQHSKQHSALNLLPFDHIPLLGGKDSTEKAARHIILIFLTLFIQESGDINRTSSSLVQNSFFPFFPPSLKETVLYTAKAHLLGNAGEATDLQGFKQRQENSSESPTEAFQAAKATTSSKSPQTKRAASLGKPKWHFNYHCLLYCPQASTYSHRSEPGQPISYFQSLLASL